MLQVRGPWESAAVYSCGDNAEVQELSSMGRRRTTIFSATGGDTVDLDLWRSLDGSNEVLNIDTVQG